MNLPLLLCLADGQFHSGSDLARAAGVSRTAIWKQIQAIESFGIEVHSIRGRGYRLPEGLDLIDIDRLRLGLDSITPSFQHIDLLLTTDSTNREAQDVLSNGIDRALVVSEHQTGGRGRRGRPWVSPFAANLYMSITWPFVGGVSALEGLSLAVGLAVRDALAQLGVDGVNLKWPNDLLLDSAKLGGILIEISGDLSGECKAVIGIGLNIKMPASVAIDQSWADLRHVLNDQLDRTDILIAMCHSLARMLNEFEVKGFSSMHERWQDHHAHQGQKVSLHMGEHIIVGQCLGVNAQGALRILTEDGEQCFQGGEVSVRHAS